MRKTKAPEKSGPKKAEPDKNGSDRKGINSVEVGLRVLATIAGGDGPMALKTVSEGSGLSRSQTHRYLTSLIRSGTVVQDPATGLYDLGPEALRIGLAALGRVDAVREAEAALDRLVDQIQETSMLAVWGERGPIAIRWRRGASLIFSTVGLGTTFPLLTSTTGQLFLAYMPRTITQPLLKKEDTSKIESLASIDGAYKDVSNLESLIGAVRKQGHASMEGHLVPGVWSASAPVFDSQGEIVAGLTIVGNATDGEPERATATKKLKAIAAESSATLGWTGG